MISITEPSREMLERIFRNEWNSIDFKLDYVYNKSTKVIATCKELGMYSLAEEFENDLKMEQI